MRIIAYLQVSTSTQVENGAGLDVQEQTCGAYAETSSPAGSSRSRIEPRIACEPTTITSR